MTLSLHESRKKWIFYGQADRNGGGGASVSSALTISKCENFEIDSKGEFLSPSGDLGIGLV